jgi:hypothetical protein
MRFSFMYRMKNLVFKYIHVFKFGEKFATIR